MKENAKVPKIATTEKRKANTLTQFDGFTENQEWQQTLWKDPECIHLQRKGVCASKTTWKVQGVFLRQVFRVRWFLFVCLNAGGITCSGYPGKPPPSPPPSSCSSPWLPAGRLKHTKHAKLNSNLNNGKSFWQKYQKKKKTNLRSICKIKRGHKHDVYL